MPPAKANNGVYMFYRAKKIPPIRKIHGGKFYLCRDIISLIEPRSSVFTFVDAAVGGGSVILNVDRAAYPKTCRFVAADLDPEIVDMFLGVKCGDDFLVHLQDLRYSEETFLDCCQHVSKPRSSSLPKWASRYIAKYRMSRGGLGGEFAWSERLRGGRPGDLNAWENFKNKHIYEIIDSLSGVRVDESDILETIDQFDHGDAIFYLDLPYPHEARTARGIYAREMESILRRRSGGDAATATVDATTHEDVLRTVLKSRGRFYISGYHCPLYDKMLKNFDLSEFDMPNHSSQSKVKERRVECLWCKS